MYLLYPRKYLQLLKKLLASVEEFHGISESILGTAENLTAFTGDVKIELERFKVKPIDQIEYDD